MNGISVIVLNDNGRGLLLESLSRNLAALAAAPVPIEVVVVDNDSTDGSAAMLAAKFPMVRVVALPHNASFVNGNNAGAAIAKHSHLLFLNNELALEPGYIDVVAVHFDTVAVFAVDGRMNDWDGDELQAGAKGLSFNDGWFAITPPRQPRYAGAQFTLYATGDGMTVDREKFMALGGFDSLFDTFDAAALDLSYRAWKQGWLVIHEPRAVARHWRRATTPTFSADRHRRWADLRNRWFWFWKNIDDRVLLAAHAIRLPAILAEQVRAEGTNAIAAFGWALVKLPAVLAARRSVSCGWPDRSIEWLLRKWS